MLPCLTLGQRFSPSKKTKSSKRSPNILGSSEAPRKHHKAVSHESQPVGGWWIIRDQPQAPSKPKSRRAARPVGVSDGYAAPGAEGIFTASLPRDLVKARERYQASVRDRPGSAREQAKITAARLYDNYRRSVTSNEISSKQSNNATTRSRPLRSSSEESVKQRPPRPSRPERPAEGLDDVFLGFHSPRSSSRRGSFALPPSPGPPPRKALPPIPEKSKHRKVQGRVHKPIDLTQPSEATGRDLAFPYIDRDGNFYEPGSHREAGRT